ncbi:cyclase family protein [Nonomuraea sp. NBC_01738]|uniref:cyclase family protein n=1 Tax=Nonomuraea sp. NBC_01738 TaxID=2976003 RepID=UPI002E13E7A1|nr:cyclase family protein [Nonomuraea sp. NBC_01738]
MVAEPNNWGRFGPADQRGTLNLLTPGRVLAALATARTGEIVSLAAPIGRNAPHLRGRPSPQHFMSIDGADFAAGTRPVGAGLRMADDALIVSAHGTTTHMDALCHMWSGDELYNGHPASEVHSYGAKRCGIDQVGGLVARAVFYDLPSHRHVDHLPAGHRVLPEELAEISEIGPGDVAVIRTGWPRVWQEAPERYAAPQPGLSAAAGRWLAERDVAAVACDNAAIGGLNERGLADEPVEDDLHLILLHRHGIHLLEMLWLEDLVAPSPGEFLFVAAPLRLSGGTASPVTPLAIL